MEDSLYQYFAIVGIIGSILSAVGDYFCITVREWTASVSVQIKRLKVIGIRQK